MKNDLISRSALKSELNSRPFPQDYSTTLLLGTFNELIDNAPAVELDGYVLYGTGLELVSTDWLDEQLGKDRRRGKWIEKRDDNGCLQLYCNQCGTKAQVGFISFCGKCGADMRGDKND